MDDRYGVLLDVKGGRTTWPAIGGLCMAPDAGGDGR